MEANKEQQNVNQTPPQSAEQLMNQVQRHTRKKFTAEEKIRIVLEGMKREITVSELCRQECIPPPVYYRWTKDFMEAGKSRLKRDGTRDATKSEVTKLRKENEQLKSVIGDKELVIKILKKSL